MMHTRLGRAQTVEVITNYIFEEFIYIVMDPNIHCDVFIKSSHIDRYIKLRQQITR